MNNNSRNTFFFCFIFRNGIEPYLLNTIFENGLICFALQTHEKNEKFQELFRSAITKCDIYVIFNQATLLIHDV